MIYHSLWARPYRVRIGHFWEGCHVGVVSCPYHVVSLRCAYELYPLVRIASYRTLLGGVSAWFSYRLVSVLYRLVSCVRIRVVGYGVIQCDTERGECSDILIVPECGLIFSKCREGAIRA